MRVISKGPIDDFVASHPDAESALEAWYTTVRREHWRNFSEVRLTYATASIYERCVIFNIGGNKYRLVASIHYETTRPSGKVIEGRVYVRNILTHAEYDRDKWKRGCEC